jgi:hypothetical protein
VVCQEIVKEYDVEFLSITFFIFLNYICKFSSNVHIIPFIEGKQLCRYNEAAVIATSIFCINAHNVDVEDPIKSIS